MLLTEEPGLDGQADAACFISATVLKDTFSDHSLFSKQQFQAAPRSEPDDDKRQLERDQGPQAPAPRGSPPPSASTTAASASSGSSLAAINASALDQVRRAATCGLCSSLVAGSLVLSCGHQFCGSCLIDFLNQKPHCPTCQVSLRAIPVRCLALDGVVEALGRVLDKSELEAYRARAEEGKSAANKINKMFWWLQPATIPTLGDPQAQSCDIGDTNNASLSHAAAASAAASMAIAGGMASRVRGASASCGGAVPPPSRLQQPQRATMDHHNVPPLQAQAQISRFQQQQQQQQGGPMLPAFLDAIGVQPPQHPIYEDCGYGSARPGAGHGFQRDPPRMPFFAPNGARIARPPVTRNGYGNAPVPAGIDASHLVSMGLNPPLASRAMVQQQQQQGGQMPSFYDLNAAAAAAAAQPNLPPTAVGQLPYLPDYGLGLPQRSISAQDHMANLQTQAQLQQLLNSLAIAEMYTA